MFNPKRKLSPASNLSIQVGDSCIQPSLKVRNLGAIFDTHLDMEHHVNAVSRTCYTQIRNISKIRQYLTIDATKSLVNSTVTSRLDYCNGLLYGANQSAINRLQVVQNTAARLITKTPKHAHITPVLKQLHWLPVNRRVEYKVIVHVYKAMNGQGPEYLNNLLTLYSPRRQLRSADDHTLLVAPRTRTVTYGERCFTTAAPKLWNTLPRTLRESQSLTCFKKALKTHLFCNTYTS